MDDVSGLSDKYDNFVDFLAVSQKFKYSCVYIFHIIYSEKSIWKLILSPAKIFNIFPGSIAQSSIFKILSANCIRETVSHLLQNSMDK